MLSVSYYVAFSYLDLEIEIVTLHLIQCCDSFSKQCT